MTNSVLAAKQGEDPENFCTIDDVKVTEKNVHVVSFVGEDGRGRDTEETYYSDVDSGYYSCQGCQWTWYWTMTNRSKIWQKVKEHLND